MVVPVRRLPLAVAVASALLATALVPQLRAADPPRPAARELCGRHDLPETGLQGDVPRQDRLSGRAERGYNCGVAPVGYSSLGERGGNWNMAWSGHCAYVSSGSGVAVVDVSDPRAPRHVTTLAHGRPGSTKTNEAIHAVTTPERAVLVAGEYQIAPNDEPTPMDVYDVRDCAHPRLLSTYVFPRSIHNLTLSADGTRVFSTSRLQAADLTDLANPKPLPEIEPHIPATGINRNFSHEAWPSPDGTRLYIGGQVAGIGEIFTILDLSAWPADPVPKVVSQFVGRGHSIRLVRIGGRPYVLHSEESILDPTAKGCVPEETNPFAGAAQPWLTDIGDERSPRTVSQFRLEINEPVNCGAQVASGVNASVHYHDVDDPEHTRFALLSMWNAGLRIVDVRDAARPTEVAYFNPGAFRTDDGGTVLDQAWAHVRYDATTGHIWLATETGGFWVLELEPQVRRHLGLPGRPPVNPLGAPARPAPSPSQATSFSASVADATPFYCPLAAA